MFGLLDLPTMCPLTLCTDRVQTRLSQEHGKSISTSIALFSSSFLHFLPEKIWLITQGTSKITSPLQFFLTSPRTLRITSLSHCIGPNFPRRGDWACGIMADFFLPVFLPRVSCSRIRMVTYTSISSVSSIRLTRVLLNSSLKERSKEWMEQIQKQWGGAGGKRSKLSMEDFRCLNLSSLLCFRFSEGRQSRGSKPTAMLIYSNCQFNYELLITKQVEYW